MVNINFVPDDYIQGNEARRTNVMYLILFLIVMAVMASSFVIIKVRQELLATKERHVNVLLKQAEESIKKFEELQQKRKIMTKTALTTIELLEPVPRSLLLASLTNNLPAGVSLLQLNIVQKMPETSSVQAVSKYAAQKAKTTAGITEKDSPEKLLEVFIGIEGIAPSDVQVAQYIKNLSDSVLVENVTLIESKQHKIEDTKFRDFTLKATLRKEINLSKEDVETIKNKG